MVAFDRNPQDFKYLRLLSRQFPTEQSAFTEIINLSAILNLPKGTEHFMSDVHGEYEAFMHILNNCSGVVREHVDEIFGDTLSFDEKGELCTLIYYPREKIDLVRSQHEDSPTWYKTMLDQLIMVARSLSSRYTRSKVRKAIPRDYAYIIDELLHTHPDENNYRVRYHERIVESILETASADDFIESLALLIKRLAVDHLHLVGDIFDRGPRADLIIDRLMAYHSIDVQWGNHDIVWMGAASGSAACLAAVIRNNVRYDSLKILESAYGVSLRELTMFAEQTYRQKDGMDPVEKAISVILFKLEGQTILRHPNWQMDDRLLLEHVDPARGVVTIDGVEHKMRTSDFPTLDPQNPYSLSEGEQVVMENLMSAVLHSEKLQAHIGFLYDHGAAYLVHNGNVLFHACVPMNEDGTFCSVSHQGKTFSGKDYYDYSDRLARRAWHEHDQVSLDWMWYLWCGRYSPLSGRVMKTFERTYLADKSTWDEPRDPYFEHVGDPVACRTVLEEFGCSGDGVIINGHTPVHASAGENPVKAGGMLVVIDGGFCQAYHQTTGIAGYTLIADPSGMRIKAHRPFASIKDVLDLNADIMSDDDRFRRWPRPLTVGDTDDGVQIREQIADLRELLAAYRNGDITERAR